MHLNRGLRGVSPCCQRLFAATRVNWYSRKSARQTEFLPRWASVRQMLQSKLIDCDAAICLIGTARGGGRILKRRNLKMRVVTVV